MRHPWQLKSDRCDRFFRGAGVWRDSAAAPEQFQDSEEICCDTCSATRVARQGVPAHVCNYEDHLERWSFRKVPCFHQQSNKGAGRERGPQKSSRNFVSETGQWNPKYGCKGTVTTCFALIALVAWQHWFDSTLRKLSVYPKYG